MNFEKNEIALRYAKSIFEYAITSKVEKTLFKEIEFLKQLFANNLSFITFCSSPLINFNDKQNAIEELALNQFTKNFLLFLLYEKRFNLLIPILDKVRLLLLELNQAIDVEFVTAQPINDTDLQYVNNIIKRIVKKEANIVHRIDETILGGLIIKIGSKILNASLLKKITTVSVVAKEAILEFRE